MEFNILDEAPTEIPSRSKRPYFRIDLHSAPFREQIFMRIPIYIYIYIYYIYIYIKYRIYHHVWRRCLAVKSANAYIWYPVSRDREAWADPKPIFWQLFHEFVSAALGFHSSRLAYGITRQRRYIATTAFSFVTRILLYST